MAVRLYSEVQKMLDEGAGKFVQILVNDARGNAPVDTGNLVASITGIKVGVGSYIVTTQAVGRNGVAYPAKIETGESVSGYQRFIYHGREIRTNFVAGTSKPRFMSKTVSKYGGR